MEPEVRLPSLPVPVVDNFVAGKEQIIMLKTASKSDQKLRR